MFDFFSDDKNKILYELIANNYYFIENPVEYLHTKLPKLNIEYINAILYDLLKNDFISVNRDLKGINALPCAARTYQDTLPLTEEEKRYLMGKAIYVDKDKIIIFLSNKKEERYYKIKSWAWETFKWIFPLLVGWFLKSIA